MIAELGQSLAEDRKRTLASLAPAFSTILPASNVIAELGQSLAEDRKRTLASLAPAQPLFAGVGTQSLDFARSTPLFERPNVGSDLQFRGIGQSQKSPPRRPIRSVSEIMLGRQFDAIVTEKLLTEVSRDLFVGGHFTRAVEEAYKCFDNEVKRLSGLREVHGATLMTKAFSPKNPVLRMNGLVEESERNEQSGYMRMFEGSMIGIRNPRAHECTDFDDRQSALELLAMANHFLRKTYGANRSPN
ncbi:MAG: TIGR02391 family protein [Chloroflexota bacterium]|nr:TIGR02391 family protein [Chloroflexota bacterium]